MITFRLLQVFRQVVDSGSITQASEQLSLSQPTVSLQIKKLSSEVGLPLINIVNGKIAMTQAGKAVYQCAQEISASQNKLASHIEALQGVQKGVLSISVVTTAKYVLPPMLAEFCNDHTGLDIQFKVSNRAQVIERLEGNRDDIYIFSYPPDSKDIEKRQFMQNRLQIIAPLNYQGPDNCSLQDLSDQRFLLREEGSGTRKTIDEYLQRNEIVLSNTMLVESNEAIKLSVASGLGIAILSEHTIAQNMNEKVKFLNITDFPLISYWYAVTVKDRPQNLACEAFLAFLNTYQDQRFVNLISVTNKD